MCVPGSINNKNTEGVYKLLKNGATMVTRGEDILNALGWEVIKNKQDKKNESSVPPEYKAIIDIIDIEPKCFDELQSAVRLDTEELLKLLTMMEVEGLIEQTNGDRYKRV